MNYFEQENELIKKLFKLDEVLDFQLSHSIKILRGEDYQYMCHIDDKVYATALTSIGALVFGIVRFKSLN